MSRKMGFEFEFQAIQLENGLACTRDLQKAIWRDWSKMPHVELYTDYGTKQPVGVMYTQKDGRSFLINTDGGVCLPEFGFLPFDTLDECYDNMKEILGEYISIAKKHGVGLLAYGIQPKTPWFYPDLKTEKTWYRSFGMMPYFQRWHNQYHNISAHQPCIDISYDEIVPVVNTLNAIGGVTIALFANTSVGESRIMDYHEEREFRWERLVEGQDENVRKIQGIPKEPFKCFRDYLTYNWSILLPSVFRGKTQRILQPLQTIKDYLRKDRWGAFDIGDTEFSELVPNTKDVNDFNMYIWIQSRPKLFFDESRPLSELLAAYDDDKIDDYAKKHMTKLYVETRNIASQSWDEILTGPAFILGLIENIEPAYDLVKSKPWEYWIGLRLKTIKESMKVDEAVPFAEKLVEISEQGLKNRGLGEEKYLVPLYKRIEERKSPAMHAIEEYNEKGLDGLIQSRLIKI